jgi:hypothetical protein
MPRGRPVPYPFIPSDNSLCCGAWSRCVKTENFGENSRNGALKRGNVAKSFYFHTSMHRLGFIIRQFLPPEAILGGIRDKNKSVKIPPELY